MQRKRGRPLGRHPETTKEARANADELNLQVAMETHVARQKGQPLKGQSRTPRPVQKIRADVAKRLVIPGNTLKDHHRKHGAGTTDRVVEELVRRAEKRDEEIRQVRASMARKTLHDLDERPVPQRDVDAVPDDGDVDPVPHDFSDLLLLAGHLPVVAGLERPKGKK